ncbi:MAG: NAD-dependent epimerase/dehydratase family protein [Gammaproteobacteria bacterium]
MNILITGGTGFIGSALTKSLIEHGHAVTVLSRSPDKVAKTAVRTLMRWAALRSLRQKTAFRSPSILPVRRLWTPTGARIGPKKGTDLYIVYLRGRPCFRCSIRRPTILSISSIKCTCPVNCPR